MNARTTRSLSRPASPTALSHPHVTSIRDRGARLARHASRSSSGASSPRVRTRAAGLKSTQPSSTPTRRDASLRSSAAPTSARINVATRRLSEGAFYYRTYPSAPISPLIARIRPRAVRCISPTNRCLTTWHVSVSTLQWPAQLDAAPRRCGAHRATTPRHGPARGTPTAGHSKLKICCFFTSV